MNDKENRRPGGIEAEGITSGLSITARITIWYMLFLAIVAIILSLVIFRMTEDRIKAAAENKLAKVVDELGDTISEDGDDFILDKKIRYYYKDKYISVYDMDEDLVTGRRPRGIDVFPPLNADKIQITEDASGSEWYSYDNIIEVDGKKLYIRGMLNNVAEDGRYSSMLRLTAVLLPIILIFAGIGGYLITRRAFAPVREIIGITKDITGDGDFSRRIPLGKSHDEIYELSESFNDMFDRVEDVIKREKQFTADVSHELRTPLAIIQTQSEFAREDEGYAAAAIKVINRASRRRRGLISNLLMIARSDAGRMEPDVSEVDVSLLLPEFAEIKRADAEAAGCVIETDIEEGITLRTDEELFARIILNLIDNAIKYGKRPGGIVRLSAGMQGGELVCRVSDNGDGVKAGDRDKIWERFYRADEARSEGSSSGLGLAIVTALSKALGGSVKLLSDEESELGGAAFELRLPASE